MTLEKEAITGTELSGLVRSAVEQAMGKFGEEARTPTDVPVAGAVMAQDYPVPANDIMKAIHSWTLNPDATPPSDSQVIQLKQDGSVELISNDELERRLQQAEMNQVSAAGFIGNLDGATSAIPIVGKIPFGSILFGAVPGALVSEVVDGLMAPRNADGSLNFMNLGAKVLIAGVGATFGRRFIGNKAAGFFAAGLLIFVAADFLPVDQWVARLVSSLGGTASASQAQPSASAPASQGADHQPLATSGGEALDVLRNFQAQGMAEAA